jgi:hypothetical protein
MQTHAKINERLTFSRASDWVPMANFAQVCAAGFVPVASPEAAVSVQLRKATSAAGANADDLGSSAGGNGSAVAQAYASELGETAGGIPFTHVSAVITGAGGFGTVVRGAGRFNP